MSEVIVYHKPNCSQCESTMADLKKLNIDFKDYYFSEKPEVLKHVKALGFRKAPIVTVDTNILEVTKDNLDESKVWSDYIPLKIQSILENVDTVEDSIWD